MHPRSLCLAVGIALFFHIPSAAAADITPVDPPAVDIELNRPAGSNAATATLIDANPFSDGDTTTGKGDDASLLPCIAGNDNAEDAWYRLELAGWAQLKTWTTCLPSAFDTRLAVYDDQIDILACNDDDPLCLPEKQSTIQDLVLAPGTYYIVVDGGNNSSGYYSFNASWVDLPAPCDGSDADNPTVIDQIPYVHANNTVDDCHDILIDCDNIGGGNAPDHWYEVTFDTDVYVDVTTVCNGQDLDTQIAILDQAQQQLFCNDDAPGCLANQSKIEDAPLASGTYYIVVDGTASVAGTYTVQVDTTHAPPGAIVELLPDLTCRENELYDNDIVTTIEAGRTHLRLSNATPNTGTGKLYVYGTFEDNGDGTQDVFQRIWDDQGAYRDQRAGVFLYHSSHNHIHLEGWSRYRLRELVPPDGVGPILAEGDKTSFCVVDLIVHDNTLPGFNSQPEFTSCSGSVQGLSIGWADIYNKSLTGQNIDITDVPDGEYWLEAEVDPDDHIKELDEGNNVTRILVTIGAPQQLTPDAFEPNDDLSSVQARVVGGINSPNLGPTGPVYNDPNLNVHLQGNDDVFRFYMPANGGPNDEIRIDFVHGVGDLDLHLLNDSGGVLAVSNSVNNFEEISLTGRSAGWYSARVFGFNGATGAYALTVDPSSNGTPTIAVDAPPAGNVDVQQGTETYTIEWTASDPDSNPTWVTVFLNTTNTLDGNEMLVETSVNTDGAQGQHVFNTAEVPLDTYYVYTQVTDGGTVSGAWSDGTITLVDPVTSNEPATLVAAHLEPARPNPFNPSTLLEMVLPEAAPVSWRIYDLRGHLVRTLESGFLPAGSHQRVWHALDDHGQQVASGVYLQALDAPGVSERQKLVLLK